MRRRAQIELDAELKIVAKAARKLSSSTSRADSEAEREARIDAANAGRPFPSPKGSSGTLVSNEVWAALRNARARAKDAPAATLYASRLDELALELEMLEVLGDARRIRPLAQERFGRATQTVTLGKTSRSLWDVALRLLEETRGTPHEPRIHTAQSDIGPSLHDTLQRAARSAGLEVEIRVEPSLVADAAAGERTIFIADRRFGWREMHRLAAHEVMGHMVSAANARSQPTALLSVGTAGSLSDQEGVAIALEEEAGLLDDRRVRTLAARVLVSERVHEGASAEETTRELMQDHGFDARGAVALCDRAHRGGGLARDIIYLRGWLRVRRALIEKQTTIDELRMGRVGVDDIPLLRHLVAEGHLRSPLYRPGPYTPPENAGERVSYRPSFARNRGATALGTSASTSPPSFAASLTKLDET